jgi:amidase
MRRWALGFALICGACTAKPPANIALDAEIAALDAVDLEARLVSGELSAERVTWVFLGRIESLNEAGPALHAVVEVNPDALTIARELDRRRAKSGPVGPLHGLPILIKANIDTADGMATSAGSVALARHRAAADAPVVAQLRAAGAVILGKANLSEWANFRSTRSTSGWSSLGGQARNPYVLDRSPCGSSSGSAAAVAAALAPLAIGTETDGSIVCPSAVNGVAGIKPTLGLVSGRGIVPIARSQDTAGPIARNVRDAALLLRAIEEPGKRPEAHAWRASSAPIATPSASGNGHRLAGVRLGVVRDYSGAGKDRALDEAFARWLEQLRALGAELVDPIGTGLGDAVESAELTVLLHEFSRPDRRVFARRSRRAALARGGRRVRSRAQGRSDAALRSGSVSSGAQDHGARCTGLSRRGCVARWLSRAARNDLCDAAARRSRGAGREPGVADQPRGRGSNRRRQLDDCRRLGISEHRGPRRAAR